MCAGATNFKVQGSAETYLLLQAKKTILKARGSEGSNLSKIIFLRHQTKLLIPPELRGTIFHSPKFQVGAIFFHPAKIPGEHLVHSPKVRGTNFSLTFFLQKGFWQMPIWDYKCPVSIEGQLPPSVIAASVIIKESTLRVRHRINDGSGHDFQLINC